MNQIRSRLAGAAIAVTLALGAAAPAHAAGCTVSATGLAFGAYEPLTFAGQMTSVAVNSDATVSIVCTGINKTRSFTLSLGPSLVGSGNRINTRYMANSSGGADMAFNVYREAGRTTVWGDGKVGGSTITGSVPPGDSTLTRSAYGKIPAGQNTLRAGSFSGSMTMTLTVSP